MNTQFPSPSSSTTSTTFSSPRVEATFRYHFRKSLQQQKFGSSTKFLTPVNIAMNAPASYSSPSPITSGNNKINTNSHHKIPNFPSYDLIARGEDLLSNTTRQQLNPTQNSRRKELDSKNDHGTELFTPNYLGEKYHWITTTSPENTLSMFVPSSKNNHSTTITSHDDSKTENERRGSDQRRASTVSSIDNDTSFDDRIKQQLHGGLGKEIKRSLIDEYEHDEVAAIKQHETTTTNAENNKNRKTTIIQPNSTTAEIVLQTYCWSVKLLFSERENLAQKYAIKKKTIFDANVYELKWEKSGPRKR